MDAGMIVLGFFALFVAVLWIITDMEQKMAVKGLSEPEPSCPPHRWQYDKSGKMECTRCLSRPGTIRSEEDIE